jgi:hypothetical protein
MAGVAVVFKVQARRGNQGEVLDIGRRIFQGQRR